MHRRGFLQGIFGGVASAGLIIAAKPSEIEAFTAPLAKGAPLVLDQPTANPEVAVIGEHLYNSRGEIVAIVTGMDFSSEAIEVTSSYDVEPQFIRGPMRVDIRAVGIGPVRWENGAPKLRGRRA